MAAIVSEKQIDDMILKIDELKYIDSKEALKLALNALEISKANDCPKAEAILLSKIGNIYSNMGEFSKATEYITKAISQLGLYDMELHLCSAYCILGNIFYELSDYAAAFDYYNKSTYIAKRNNYRGQLSIAYNNIGEIYKVLLNCTKAMEYYQRSLDEDHEIDLRGRGVTYINLAEIHYLNTHYALALEFVSTGLSLLKKYNNELLLCEGYRVYALIYWKMDNHEIAKEYFLKALEIADKKMAYNYKIEILISYHIFLVEQNQIETAIQTLSDAYELALTNNLHEKSILICRHFITTFEKIEDSKSALKYYRLYIYHDQEQSKIRTRQISDGIELRIKAEENKLQSEIDPLTGVLNRRKFLQVLNEQWNYSKKHGYPMSLIVIDVDYFKEFNDNYGHPAGDKCIKTIARILSSITEKRYFLSRYGGDEFIAVLPLMAAAEASTFAESMRLAVHEAEIPHEYSPISDFVTITLGCAAMVPEDSFTINDLIKKADDALYAAKRNGRNRVIIS